MRSLVSNIVYFSYCDDLTYSVAEYLIEIGGHFVVVFVGCDTSE